MFSCGEGVRRGLIVIFPFSPGLDLFSFLQTESQVSSQTSEDSFLDADGIVFPCPVSLGISKCFPVGGECSSLSPYSHWHCMFTPVPSWLCHAVLSLPTHPCMYVEPFLVGVSHIADTHEAKNWVSGGKARGKGLGK